MRKDRVQRWIGLLGLTLVSSSSGCTHNYYYGTQAGCPPLGQPVSAQVGQVCEVPSGTIVTSGVVTPGSGQAGSAAQVVTTDHPQRVVISQPAYTPSFANRYRWHRTDPETIATTRSDGALQESVPR